MPEVRSRRQRCETATDELFVRWVARFRFVSSEVVGERFGISARMCRARLGRLERAGLIRAHQAHAAAPKLYAIGSRGRTLLGLEHRRPPRWDIQVVHELAIARLVAQLETSGRDVDVLTERDCRRATSAGRGTYSVACQLPQGLLRRWPDIVTEGELERTAIEIELTPKSTRRLAGILLGYLTDGSYDRVEYHCGTVGLERRIGRLVHAYGGEHTIRVRSLTS